MKQRAWRSLSTQEKLRAARALWGLLLAPEQTSAAVKDQVANMTKLAEQVHEAHELSCAAHDDGVLHADIKQLSKLRVPADDSCWLGLRVLV
jgi:hypothetical protein